MEEPDFSFSFVGERSFRTTLLLWKDPIHGINLEVKTSGVTNPWRFFRVAAASAPRRISLIMALASCASSVLELAEDARRPQHWSHKLGFHRTAS